MKKKPYISIVLPTYERHNTLRRAISSVLSQNYNYFELIIIDDSKTNKISKIVNKFNDDRIRYVHTKMGKRGVSAARNHGIELSSYKLLAFIDDDDVWRKEKLNVQVRKLRSIKKVRGINKNKIIYATQYEFVYLNGKRTIIPNINDDVIVSFKEIIHTNIVGMSSVLIKKSVFKKIGYFDNDFRRFNDWEMWLRASSNGYKFYIISKPLVVINQTPNNISSDMKLLLESYEKLFLKYSKYFKRYRAAYSKHLSIYSASLIRMKKINKGFASFMKSLIYFPDIKNIIRIISSMVS